MSPLVSDENTRAMYAEFWNQTRHVETQRNTFTAIYSAIIAGILAFIAQVRPSTTSTSATLDWELSLYGFMWWLSVLGFLVSIRTWADLNYYVKCTDTMQKQGFGCAGFGGRPPGWTKLISTRFVFTLFYAIPLGVTSVVLCLYLIRWLT